ncbi:MAG: hypothetical protein AAF501_02870 [Pseudomonadota bacterium]
MAVESEDDVSRSLHERLRGNRIEIAILLGEVPGLRVKNAGLPVVETALAPASKGQAMGTDPGRFAVITFAGRSGLDHFLSNYSMQAKDPGSVFFRRSACSALAFALVRFPLP